MSTDIPQRKATRLVAAEKVLYSLGADQVLLWDQHGPTPVWIRKRKSHGMFNLAIALCIGSEYMVSHVGRTRNDYDARPRLPQQPLGQMIVTNRNVQMSRHVALRRGVDAFGDDLHPQHHGR